MTMVPASRPRMSLAEVTALVAPLGLALARDPLFIVGVRGYYRDTMGAPGRNDRGIYDDALFIVSRQLFAAYNANTDPSRVRKGSGHSAGKGMAALEPGLWRSYRVGMHRAGTRTGHRALIQIGGAVTVMRDGNPPYPATGHFGINIHRGGRRTTSSEGCQTIPPDQWPSFIANVIDQAKRAYGASWGVTTIPYALVDPGAA